MLSTNLILKGIIIMITKSTFIYSTEEAAAVRNLINSFSPTMAKEMELDLKEDGSVEVTISMEIDPLVLTSLCSIAAGIIPLAKMIKTSSPIRRTSVEINEVLREEELTDPEGKTTRNKFTRDGEIIDSGDVETP